MQKITPHLWFDKEAKEAAKFYTSLFDGSRVTSTITLHDTPSGPVDVVSIELAGQQFDLISAGPFFQFTPAISFMVSCATKREVDELWRELSRDGKVMLDLGSYPFSERYGWTTDRYGLSWQVMLAARPVQQKITPILMFTGANAGKAEEALRFYASVFGAPPAMIAARYSNGEEPEKEGTVKFATFTLAGQHFAAMDSARTHGFGFNEAISFEVFCDTQAEIDEYWSKLSADPKAEQCGWLKDRYGLSWQIVPTAMRRMIASGDDRKLARVTQAFLKMKKFDVAKLEAAYESA